MDLSEQTRHRRDRFAGLRLLTVAFIFASVLPAAAGSTHESDFSGPAGEQPPNWEILSGFEEFLHVRDGAYVSDLYGDAKGALIVAAFLPEDAWTWTDYTVETRFRYRVADREEDVPTLAANTLVRIQDCNQFYMVQFQEEAGGFQFRIGRMSDRGFSQLTRERFAGPEPFQNDGPLTMRIKVSGETIEAHLLDADGELLSSLETDEVTFPSGPAGLRALLRDASLTHETFSVSLPGEGE